MGAVGADWRGSLEEDQAWEEAAGVPAGPRVWGAAGPRGTERRRPGTGVPGLWDGDGEAEPGLKDPGMETQVWGPGGGNRGGAWGRGGPGHGELEAKTQAYGLGDLWIEIQARGWGTCGCGWGEWKLGQRLAE